MAAARKIAPEEWESHKAAISTLYLTEQKTLDEVIRLMADEHGFFATKAQYVRKLKNWNVGKYSSHDKWEHAAYLVEKRRLGGKDTNILMNEVPVPAKKLRKELSRYSHSQPSVMVQPDESTSNQTEVIAVTPPAVTEAFHRREYAAIPWFQFQDLIESSMAAFNATIPLGPCWGSTSFLGSDSTPALLGFDTPMYDQWFDPHQHHPMPIAPLDAWQIAPEFHQELGSGLLGASDYDQTVPDWGQNFTMTEASVEPWEVEHTNREVRVLLGECLSEAIDPDSSEEYVSKISSNLEEIAIEKNNGDLVRHVKKMFSSSTFDATLQLLRYTIYLSSNNLLSHSKTDKLLKWVVETGKFWAIECLLKAELPTTKIFASNFLVSAARLKATEVFRALLQANANPNTLSGSDSKTTALHEAIKNGDTTLVQLLLESGVSPNIGDHPDIVGTPLRTALQLNLRRHDNSIAMILIEHGADVNALEEYDDSLPLLVIAVESSDLELVQRMLKAGARINEVSPLVETTALKEAIAQNVEMVEILLAAGADVDFPSGRKYQDGSQIAADEGNYDFFNTPLLEAVWKGDLEIIHILLVAGANVNSLPARGYVRWLDYGRCQDSTTWVTKEDNGGFDKDYLCLVMQSLITPFHAAILEKNVFLVRLFLSLGADIDAVAARGNALQIAAALPSPTSTKMVQLLLSKGADAKSAALAPGSKTALQAAAASGDEDLVGLLLKAGAEVNAPPNYRSGETALQAAVTSGKLNLVKLLVKAGGNVNAPAAPIRGRTCIQAAAALGDTEMLDLLISLGADVSCSRTKDCVDQTALTAAIVKRHDSMTQRLLRRGAQVERSSFGEDGGASALCAAVESNQLDVVRLLLHSGANPNARRGSETPLGCAAMLKFSSIDVVRCLIQAGADVDKLSDGRTPLEIVARRNRNIADDFIHALVEANANLKGPAAAAALTIIVKDNNVSLVRFLLTNGMKSNQDLRSAKGGPLLHATQRWSINEDMVEVLLDHGFNPRADDGLPIQLAAAKGQVSIVQRLLRAGADVNAPAISRHQKTALQGAARSGNIDLVKMLLDADASINATPAPEWGETALQAAVDIGSVNIVKLLLLRGADVNGPPSPISGATALQKASIRGHLRIASILIKHGAKINAAGAANGGRTALEAAAEHERLDVACLLLRHDDDPETLGTRCKRAAKLAQSSGNYVLADVLKEWGEKHGVDDCRETI